MKPRIMFGVLIALLALLAGGAYLVYGRGIMPAAGRVTPQPILAGAPAETGSRVAVQGKVVPARSVTLSLLTGGLVAEIPVEEGDLVEKGQLLLRLGTDRQLATLGEARAGLAVAKAQLVRARLGPKAEDIAAAEAAVEVARAGVRAAESAAEVTRAGVETAQGVVMVARAGVGVAEGGVAIAQAGLLRARVGATEEDVRIAERRVEQAKNALWGAQSQRDAVCGQRGGTTAAQGTCGSAKAGVQRAEEEVRIAELTLQQVKAGPRAEDVGVAQAQVVQAKGQMTAAEAQVAQAQGQLATATAQITQTQSQLAIARAQIAQAEAALARAKVGPLAEEIAVYEAQVQQSEAVLARTQQALSETDLYAPFSGLVAALNASVGEQVSAGGPVIQLADVSAWQIQTDDLTELQVGRVKERDRVTLTLEAIPDLELAGEVTRIRPIGENKRGDITYTVIITPDRQDSRLKWNMTAIVAFIGQ